MAFNRQEFSLSDQIKRAISNRILICSALLIFIIMGLTIYDGVISIKQLRSTINESIKPLEDFTISQLMINNPTAIAVKLDAFNRSNPEFKVSWNPNNNLDSDLAWQPPFAWSYNYRLADIAGYQFGSFKITGSFTAAKTLLHNLIFRLALLLVSLLIIFYFLYPLAKKIPEKLFLAPINQLLDMISNPANEAKKKPRNLPIEFKDLKAKILALIEQAKEYERSHALIHLGKISSQVAHDIRSPLASLQILVEQKLPEISDSKRIVLRDAINQIRDITNNLEKDAFPKVKSVTQIATLLEHVVSERRAAFSNQDIEIEQNFSAENYSLFVDAIPSEIKRVVTNIINNACEAISDKTGVVNLTLVTENSKVIIVIADNGAGIGKDIIDSLFTRGFTTKKTGSGLGLVHAKETLEQFNGSIELRSELGQGTQVYLTLPAQQPPHWFVNELSLLSGSKVICVDDSISVWHVWQERFKVFNSHINLSYCNSREDLNKELEKNHNEVCTYLVDYEFSGKSYTGLDLVNDILAVKPTMSRVFLVTSRFGEEAIQNFCIKHNIYLIPKFFALKIPLKTLTTIPKNIILLPSLNCNREQIQSFSNDPLVLIYTNQNNLLADICLLGDVKQLFIYHKLADPKFLIEIGKHNITPVYFNNLDLLIEELKEKHDVETVVAV